MRGTFCSVVEYFRAKDYSTALLLNASHAGIRESDKLCVSRIEEKMSKHLLDSSPYHSIECTFLHTSHLSEPAAYFTAVSIFFLLFTDTFFVADDKYGTFCRSWTRESILSGSVFFTPADK